MNAYSRDLESDEILLRSAVVAYNDLLQGKEGATEPQLSGLRAANGVVIATSNDSVRVSRLFPCLRMLRHCMVWFLANMVDCSMLMLSVEHCAV